MKLLETVKGIVSRNPCRSRSETICTNEPTNKNMIHSCSCPQLSIKASNPQTHSSNDTYTSSNSNCNESFDDFEQEFVFIPPLTNPNVEPHCEQSSLESSMKSYDSSLSSSFEANNHKSSASDDEFHSCFEQTEANRLSCQRQISATSSGSEAIDMDDIDPVSLQFSDIPAMALSIRTRTQMSLLLNIPLTLNNDWKMLAGELEFEYVEIENFGLQKDPTGAMISQWATKGDSTLAGLLDALKVIDRFDVINSVKKFIERDAEAWRKKIERESNPFQPTPVLELSASNYPNIPVTPENRGITLHDHPDGPIETFDAFVCFTIDDRAFVLEMMKYLEKSPFNMKLCVGFRDVVPGAAWMTTSAEIIGKRCKRMIVVLSPRFTESPECDFQAKFALSLTPGNRLKRIVPIMYEMCSVPDILRFISVCDYTKEDLRPFFWERLAVALGLN